MILFVKSNPFFYSFCNISLFSFKNQNILKILVKSLVKILALLFLAASYFFSYCRIYVLNLLFSLYSLRFIACFKKKFVDCFVFTTKSSIINAFRLQKGFYSIFAVAFSCILASRAAQQKNYYYHYVLLTTTTRAQCSCFWLNRKCLMKGGRVNCRIAQISWCLTPFPLLFHFAFKIIPM